MPKDKENRKYKDSVFCDLFGTDEKADERFMSLFNALHDEPLDKVCKISRIDIEQVLYMKLANDLARLVDDKIIVLAEHQSTINENMPLRCLQYAGRIYEQLQDVREKYNKYLIKIPSPEFYVFYNGVEDYPVNKELLLSDAFKEKGSKTNLELIVNVININTKKKNKLLEKCPVMAEYSLFVDSVRRNLKEDREEGFKKAIKECMDNNILKEYLNRKSREVNNMLVAEYDYATDIEVQREEAAMKALKKGRAEGKSETAAVLKKMGFSFKDISKATGLTLSEIEKL